MSHVYPRVGSIEHQIDQVIRTGGESEKQALAKVIILTLRQFDSYTYTKAYAAVTDKDD